MKKWVIMFLMLLQSIAFGSELNSCEYENNNNKTVISGQEIFSQLMVDTSWVYVGDCPRMIGVQYKTSNVSGTEFHTLYRTETNHAKNSKKCFYHLEVIQDKKFKNVSCDMAI